VAAENASRSMCGVAMFDARSFDEYSVPPVHGEGTEVAFRVNLRLLLECLNAYGGAAQATTAVSLQYSAEDW
jgi:hypothetical protein